MRSALTELTPRAQAVGVVLLVALGTFPPFGWTGDGLRGVVLVGVGLLVMLEGLSRAHWGNEPAGLARGEVGFVAVGALAVGVALLQIVPLPMGLLEGLAPLSARVRALDGAAAAPISVEPVATLRAACLGAGLLLTWSVARSFARRHGGLARPVTLGLAGLGAVAALVAVADLASLPTRDPWLHRARTPFVNPNHLAGFLGASLALALGVSLTTEQTNSDRSARLSRALSVRGLAVLIAALSVGGVLLTRSRGGVVAAGLGASAVVALSGALGGSRRRWVAAATAVVALGLGVAWSDPEPLLGRMEEQQLGVGMAGRLDNWRVAGRVIASQPLVGTGLATFDDASATVLADGWDRATRPGDAHNDYLELAAGVGAPLGLATLVAVAWVLLGAARRLSALPPDRRGVAAGALGAAVVLLAHSWIDFPLQVPGPALIGATSLGLALGLAPTDARPRSQPSARVATPWLAVGATLAGLIGGGSAAVGVAEQRALTAVERARAAREEPAVRATLLARTRPLLAEVAALPGASAAVAQAYAYVLNQRGPGGVPPAEPDLALEQARVAVARAPARGRLQASLAVLLLRRWRRDPEHRQTAQEEALARLDLAVSLSPAELDVLLTAGQAHLALLAETGSPAHLEAAVRLLARARDRGPGGAFVVRELIAERGPSLGAARSQLEHALGLD